MERVSQYVGFWYGAEVPHWGGTKFIGPFSYSLLGFRIESLEHAEREAKTWASTYNSHRPRNEWATPLYGVGYEAFMMPEDQVGLFDMEYEGTYPTGRWTYPGLDD